jgi:hypothetical protein
VAQSDLTALSHCASIVVGTELYRLRAARFSGGDNRTSSPAQSPSTPRQVKPDVGDRRPGDVEGDAAQRQSMKPNHRASLLNVVTAFAP